MEGSRFRMVEQQWSPDLATPGPRRARRPATIAAYLPSPIAELQLAVDGRIAARISDAEGHIAAAQTHADRVGVSTIAVQLLRSEAIASSHIEGIATPSSRALARAELKLDAGAGRLSAPAAATMANLRAVRETYERAAAARGPMTVEDLLVTHRAVAQADRRLAATAGEVRTTQNWIGRDSATPVGADFIPPPASEVPRLLDDLCAYINRADLPPLLQAAIAHAQFETIHPFADGNGRVGRALIGAVLCRGALVRDVIPPISLVLSGRRRSYVDALTAWRFEHDGPARWIELLADAAEAAATASIQLADRVAELQDRWREQGEVRASSVAARLVDLLPAHPIIDIAAVAQLTGRTPEAARLAVTQLAECGVLAQVTVGRRNRAWECVGLFALVDEMERTLSGGVIDAASTR